MKQPANSLLNGKGDQGLPFGPQRRFIPLSLFYHQKPRAIQRDAVGVCIEFAI